MAYEILTPEQLEAAEIMAANGFTVDEIAHVIGPDDYMAIICHSMIPDSAFNKRYRKGYLQSMLELRQRIFKDAAHGSSPAQALAKRILDDAEFKLRSA